MTKTVMLVLYGLSIITMSWFLYSVGDRKKKEKKVYKKLEREKD